MNQKFYTPTITLHQYMDNEQVIRSTFHNIAIPQSLNVLDTSDAVLITFHGEYSENVRVYKNTDSTRKNTEINWSSCGNKPAGYAKLMAAAMTFAVQVAQAIDTMKEENR